MTQPEELSGSVTITASSAESVRGTFELSSDSSNLSGTFDVPLCSPYDLVACDSQNVERSAVCNL